MSRTIEFIRTELSNIGYWRIETWTLMVAIVALMLPWFIAFYKRVLRSGKVEIYESLAESHSQEGGPCPRFSLSSDSTFETESNLGIFLPWGYRP